MNNFLEDGELTLDLFGNLVNAIRDPRGRPSYAKSKENQILVMTLKAARWPQKDIAQYLQCDEKTLRKHFSRELDHGALIVDGMAMQVLVKKMMEGHIGATKEVRKITDLREMAPKAAPTKKTVLGKKDQLNEEAHEAPSDWGILMNKRPPAVN